MKSTNPFIVELLLAIALIGILSSFFKPIGLAMPETLHASLAVIAVSLFLTIAALAFRMRAVDEREDRHQHASGRIAYFAGTSTLIAGILIQSYAHEIDIWLVLALTVMILSRIIAKHYFDIKH